MGYGRRYSREAEPQMAAPPRTDPIEYRATRSRPTRSDALIVKTYAMSASKTPLAVLISGGFVMVEEIRIR